MDLLCAECKCSRQDHTDYLCERCRAAICGCKALPTLGAVSSDDPTCFGGHVDEANVRHDPMRHAKGCSYAR